METAFRVLFQIGPMSVLVGSIATVLAYFIYPRAPQSGRKLGFGRYLGLSVFAGLIGYGAGAAIGIVIACSTPEGGNLCGLMGIFGVGPLLAGMTMLAFACYQIIVDCRSGQD
jgi:hypothetical protein